MTMTSEESTENDGLLVVGSYTEQPMPGTFDKTLSSPAGECIPYVLSFSLL